MLQDIKSIKNKLIQLPGQVLNQGIAQLNQVGNPADVIYFFEFGTSTVIAMITRATFEEGMDKLHKRAGGSKSVAAGTVLAMSSPSFEPGTSGLIRYMATMLNLTYCQFGADKEAGWKFLTMLSVSGNLQVKTDDTETGHPRPAA